MRKKRTFDICSFIKNTFFGIAICIAVIAAAKLYIKNTGTKSVFAGNEIYTENTFAAVDSQPKPVYTETLSREELALQPETDINISKAEKPVLGDTDMEKLKNFDYLKRSFYTVDSRTQLFQTDIDVGRFASMDLSVNKNTGGPKVLIFHTHASEMYSDSDSSKGISEGVWGVGEELKRLLEARGIATMHDSGIYDAVDGKRQVLGAYERMEPNIERILKDNPSIEVCIDMHRDGVGENVRLVQDVNGKTCANVMFFNGLCRLNENGTANDIPSLPNPYLDTNLAMSFRLKLACDSLYPAFARRIYINAYRYSLNMKPKSMLIEVGAQTNTKEEAINAMTPLSEALSSILLAE